MMKWKITKGPRCASADRSSDYLRKVEDLTDPNNRTRSTFSNNDFGAGAVNAKSNGGTTGTASGGGGVCNGVPTKPATERDIVPLSENRKRSQNPQAPEATRKTSFVTTDCINLKGIFGISKDRCETPYRSLAAIDNGRRRSRSEARGTSIDRLTMAYHATPLIGPQHYIPQQNLQQQQPSKTTTSSSKKPRSSSPGKEKSGCWVRGRRRERDSRENEPESRVTCRRTISDGCKKSLNSGKLTNGRTVSDSSSFSNVNCDGDLQTKTKKAEVSAPICSQNNDEGKENVEINNNDNQHRCQQQLRIREETAAPNSSSKSALPSASTEAAISPKLIECKPPRKNRKKRIAPKPQRVSFADENDNDIKERAEKNNSVDSVADINDHRKISEPTKSSSFQAERMATGVVDCDYDDDCSGESPANEQPLSITSDISEMECQDDSNEQQIMSNCHDDTPNQDIAPTEVNTGSDQLLTAELSERIGNSLVGMPEELPLNTERDRITSESTLTITKTHENDHKPKDVTNECSSNENVHKNDPDGSEDIHPETSSKISDVPELEELAFERTLVTNLSVEKSNTLTDEVEIAVRNDNYNKGKSDLTDDPHEQFDCVSESNTDDARTDLDAISFVADSICGDLQNGRLSRPESSESTSSFRFSPSQNSESPEPPPRKRTNNHSMRVNVVVKNPQVAPDENGESPGFVVKKSFVLTVAKQEKGFRSLCASKDCLPPCPEQDKQTGGTAQQISVTFLCAAPKKDTNGIIVDPIMDNVRLRSVSMPPTNGFVESPVVSSGPPSTSSSRRSFSKDRRPKDRQSAKRKSHRSRKKDNLFNSMPQAVIDELAQVLEHRKRIPNTKAC